MFNRRKSRIYFIISTKQIVDVLEVPVTCYIKDSAKLSSYIQEADILTTRIEYAKVFESKKRAIKEAYLLQTYYGGFYQINEVVF